MIVRLAQLCGQWFNLNAINVCMVTGTILAGGATSDTLLQFEPIMGTNPLRFTSGNPVYSSSMFASLSAYVTQQFLVVAFIYSCVCLCVTNSCGAEFLIPYYLYI